MNIENIMTKKIIIGKITNTIKEVSEIMKKYDIGFLPISDKNKIIGVITDRDIVVNALTNNCNSNDMIEKYINKNIIAININKSINELLEILKQKQIKRILVTNNNKFVGIISFSDLLNKNIDDKILIDCLNNISKINKNDDLLKTEIDEFYL